MHTGKYEICQKPTPQKPGGGSTLLTLKRLDSSMKLDQKSKKSVS